MKIVWSKKAVFVWIGVTIVSLLFLATSFSLIGKGWGYVSPDETANRFFIDNFAKEGSFRVLESLNLKVGNILHPRSILASQGVLLPVSFLGLPILYGTIASLTGGELASALTIIFASLATIAWYGVVRRIVSREVATISFFLLALLPAWGYYTARLLMPNVPFVSFLIFSLWFALQKTWEKAHWRIVVAGFLLGIAVSIRLSEIIWILPIIIGLFVAYHKQLSWKSVAYFFLGASIPLIVLGGIQWQTYGSFFTTGYTFHVPVTGDVLSLQRAETTSQVAETIHLTFTQKINSWITPIFPFGIHPREIIRAVFSYGLLFWWFAIPSFLSFLWLSFYAFTKRETEEGKKFLIICGAIVIAGGWLILAYGSWSFNDNPDPNQVTIANSYVRYWLPIFVAGTIPFAWSVRCMLDRVHSNVWRGILAGSGVMAFSLLFVWSVWFSPADGLLKMRHVLAESKETRQSVLHQVDSDAVMIVDRGDKIFFPFRRVLYPLRSEQTYLSIPLILKYTPVYYFGITFPEVDMEYLNTTKLPPLGVQIEFIETFGIESLYRFVPKK